MKKGFVFILSLLLLVMAAQPLMAENTTKTIAVLPFTVHSSEDIDYIKNGIWDMLISRVSAGDKITVLDKQNTIEELDRIGKKDLTTADIYGFGKKLDIDYVVWGSITKIGNTVSLDGKLLDVSTYKTPVGIFEQCRGIDDVIPKISDFARKINFYILATSPSTSEVPPVTEKRSEDVEVTDSGTTQKNQAIDVLSTEEGTVTSIINPSSITSPITVPITSASPIVGEGFWTSEKYNQNFRGMAIGDVNNDGLNEVVIIDSQSVMIYQRRGEDFNLLNKITGNSNDNYLAVDVADINGNDIAEIIVSGINKNKVNSFILEYDGTKYGPVASDLKWFFRVIDSSGSPILLGQTKGTDKPFDTEIYRITWKNGKYDEDKGMLVPKGLSVFGLGIDSIEGNGTEMILALNKYDHLCVYRKTEKKLSKIDFVGGSDDLIWKSDDIYGSATNYFDYTAGVIGGYNPDDEEEKEKAYIKIRILTSDTNKDGKKEVIIVKNYGLMGKLLRGVGSFSRTEIYDLEWDGLGLTEKWKTKKIQGHVADYQIEDIDNDGKKEIVLIVRQSRKRSVVVAYDLNV